jgi:hypothetical protein
MLMQDIAGSEELDRATKKGMMDSFDCLIANLL